MEVRPSPEQSEQAARVFERICQAIREGVVIRLPVPTREELGERESDFALQNIAPNLFGGELGDYRYQFEGEDDLLHLAIMRNDQADISVEEAREIVTAVLPNVAPGLIWVKPGVRSQHFYVGHDVLVSDDQP